MYICKNDLLQNPFLMLNPDVLSGLVTKQKADMEQ